MTITRIKTKDTIGVSNYLVHTGTLNVAAIPSVPSSLPTSPANGDTIVETFNSALGTEIRAVIYWQYNGTSWIKVGDVAYNSQNLLDNVNASINIDIPPTVPTNFTNSTTTYVPGDTLHEEYKNGYAGWSFNGTAWTLRYARLRGNTSTRIYHYTTFNTAAVPSAPAATPTQPSTNDTIIEKFDNGTGNERIIITWVYNGTTWNLLGHVEYHTRHFHDKISSTLSIGSLPTTPVNFNTTVTTNYVPNDTLWEEYNNGYIGWKFNGTAWVQDFAREIITGGGGGADGKATLGTITTFNNASIPASPVSPPSSPNAGDIFIQAFNNTTGNQRVIMRWTYNGTTWVINGAAEYNIRTFHSVVVANINPGSLPATPSSPGTSSDYITGDTLREEYTNGYIDWIYATSSWTLRHARVTISASNKVSVASVASFNAASVPTTPVSPPTSPIANDVHIELFNNTTGNQRAIMSWTYNGTTWILSASPEYNIRSFAVTVLANLSTGSLPTAPVTPGTSSDYVPGDVLHEDYNNGYMKWVRAASSWTLQLGKVFNTTNMVTLGTVASFNMASVPTAPTSPPAGATSGDIYIETYNNTTQNQKVIIRWTYNGTIWVINGAPEYNFKRFYATVASNLTAGSLPATPATPGTSSNYVTGDTLREEYNNGYLEWTYGTSSWVLSGSKVLTNNTYVIKATTNWNENGTPPTTPENAPSSPVINDILIQSHDNATRQNAITRYWSYNGTAWVALTNGIHRFNQMFSNAPAVTMVFGVAPTASLAATTTSYVNGDVLWEKYNNGYGLYKFNNGSWALQTYGLEVGRIQDAADFQATLGAGVDGYYLIYDHDILKFTLSAT